MVINEKVKNVLEWIFCIVIAFVLAILIRYYIGTPTIVQQVSMWPTLQEDQRLILNRWVRTTKQMPERGDIITFEAPSKKVYASSDEIDWNYPVAKYENEPTNIFSKFTYYLIVRCFNKISYLSFS